MKVIKNSIQERWPGCHKLRAFISIFWVTISSYRAALTCSPLHSMPTPVGEATQGPPATSGEAPQRWHGSLEPSSSISISNFFLFLFFLLLLLFRCTPHHLQSPLQGAPHAAHPARHLQLGGWQLSSKVLHGWEVHTAGPLREAEVQLC